MLIVLAALLAGTPALPGPRSLPLGGTRTSLFRPCPDAPPTVRVAVTHQTLVDLPADWRGVIVSTPATLRVHVLDAHLLLVGEAEGPGELTVLREGQPPTTTRVEVGSVGADLTICSLCAEVPCGSRMRLYHVGDRLWFDGTWQGLEEWAAYRQLALRHPGLTMREVPAALAARAFSDANVALHAAGLTLRVRRDGAALALVDEAKVASPQAARDRADEVLRPHRALLVMVAEALAEGPTDWSFKLSPPLLTRALGAPPGPSPDSASVVIHLAAPATLELAALGIRATPVSDMLVAAEVPVARLLDLASLESVLEVLAASEVRAPTAPR